MEKELKKTLIPFEVLKVLNPKSLEEVKYNDILEPYFNIDSPITSIMWAQKSSYWEFLKYQTSSKNIIKKDAYYPIKYVSPPYINNKSIGHDLGAERQIENLLPKLSTEAMPKLLKSYPEMTAGYDGVMVILMPIFTSKYGLPRPERLDGILFGIIDFKKMIDSLNLTWDHTKISFYNSSNELIYSTDNSKNEIQNPKLSYEDYLNIGGEEFKVVFTTTQIFPRKNIKILNFVFFSLNFLFLLTASSAVYLKYLNPNKRILELVDIKTNEINSNYRKLKIAMEESNLGTIDVNIKNNKVSLNREARFLFQVYTTNKTSMEDFYNFIHPDDLTAFKDSINAVYLGVTSSFQSEIRVRPKNRSERWIFFRGEVYEKSINNKPSKLLITASDISDSKILKKNSLIDPLTRIYNRRYLDDILKNGFLSLDQSAYIFALAIFDIDYFKKINDTYGHQAGDHMLKEFTAFIKKHIRPNDILARFGGEEFVVVFKDVDRYEAAVVVNRIKNEIQSKVFVYNNREIKLTFSCGLADLSEIEKTPNYNEILKIADSRLYKAKNMGRNLVIQD